MRDQIDKNLRAYLYSQVQLGLKSLSRIFKHPTKLPQKFLYFFDFGLYNFEHAPGSPVSIKLKINNSVRI